jgi:hypothetical protein
LLCKFKIENQIDQLNTFLRRHLTEHFLPNLIVSLQTNIPLNLNGKIDRKQLYSIYLNNSSNKNLINIWQVGKLSSQNFFEFAFLESGE